MICRASRKGPSSTNLPIRNVRKGTAEILDELDSDSSSNRGMWPEPTFEEDGDSAVLISRFR